MEHSGDGGSGGGREREGESGGRIPIVLPSFFPSLSSTVYLPARFRPQSRKRSQHRYYPHNAHTEERIPREEQAGKERMGIERDEETRGRCRLLLICEITLSFTLSCLSSLFPCYPPSLPLFLPSQLVTLPVPPVSGFAVHRNARVGTYSSLDLLDGTPGEEPTDFPSHCLRRAAQSYLSLQLLSRVFSPTGDG